MIGIGSKQTTPIQIRLSVADKKNTNSKYNYNDYTA